MPPENQVNKEFFKQLFMNQKKVFKISEIKHILVPKLDEMGVKQMLPIVAEDEAIKAYFPDEFFGNTLPNRQFFFNIINTMYPGYLDQLLQNANKQRMGMVQSQQ